VTNTPMISDAVGFDRAKLIQPEVMTPPLVWLVSDAAGKVTGRRFLAVHWDTTPPLEEAAEKAGAPGRLDQNSDDADHAEPFLADIGALTVEGRQRCSAWIAHSTRFSCPAPTRPSSRQH
jgi:hypothetical protein